MKTKRNKLRTILMVLALCLVAVAVVMPAGVTHAAPLACVDGTDDVTGDPCLDLDADMLVSNIFKWANLIFPVLIPIAAIGIGIAFGSDIIAGIRRLFGSIRIG